VKNIKIIWFWEESANQTCFWSYWWYLFYFWRFWYFSKYNSRNNNL